MNPAGNPPDPSAGMREAAVGYVVATNFLVDLGLGIGLGYWADRRLGTLPLWTLVGTGVGLVLAAVTGWLLLRVLRRQRETRE